MIASIKGLQKKVKQFKFVLVLACLLFFLFILSTTVQLGADFIDINDGVNGTNIYYNTPTFNWTAVSNASQYTLQIANDSGFTDMVVNIININQFTFPSNCAISATEVRFTLPNAYALTDYKLYYCRVWSYGKE